MSSNFIIFGGLILGTILLILIPDIRKMVIETYVISMFLVWCIGLIRALKSDLEDLGNGSKNSS